MNRVFLGHNGQAFVNLNELVSDILGLFFFFLDGHGRPPKKRAVGFGVSLNSICTMQRSTWHCHGGRPSPALWSFLLDLESNCHETD